MINIYFTTSKTLGSWLIKKVTGEPVSHCAIGYENYVFHSSKDGVNLTTLESFCGKNSIVYRIQYANEFAESDSNMFFGIVEKYLSKGYDYKALLFLGLRYLLLKLHLPCPKVNLWNSSGLFMCTELVSSVILHKDDAMITPYQLYQKIHGE